MSNLDAIIDFGSKNLKLGAYDKVSENIYSSEQKINDSSEKSLKILIKDAEKNLSKHIDNVVVLYDSSKFYSLDISIKKIFDNVTSIKKVYDNLIEEAHFFISQNNFNDKIIHSVVNKIVVDKNKIFYRITDDIKIKSLILEIKFICLNKNIVNDISNIFKRSNLKILNLYCSSYVKTKYHKKNLDDKNYTIYLDVGFERTSIFIFKDNKFQFFNSVSLGGNNITKDISRVLKLTLDYSEDLKTKLNKEENNVSFNKINSDKTNPFSEIYQKNISVNLLNQIIQARVDEIIELVIYKNNYFKKMNNLNKSKLVLIGGGSKLFFNNYRSNIEKLFSEVFVLQENNSYTYEAGIDYHKSDESFLGKVKKKARKAGFFETFFNLFSK